LLQRAQHLVFMQLFSDRLNNSMPKPIRRARRSTKSIEYLQAGYSIVLSDPIRDMLVPAVFSEDLAAFVARWDAACSGGYLARRSNPRAVQSTGIEDGGRPPTPPFTYSEYRHLRANGFVLAGSPLPVKPLYQGDGWTASNRPTLYKLYSLRRSHL
jgi:hypothetical protein